MKKLMILTTILMVASASLAQSQPYCTREFCSNPVLGDIKGFCVNVPDDIWEQDDGELGPGYEGCYCPCKAYYSEDRKKAKENKN